MPHGHAIMWQLPPLVIHNARVSHEVRPALGCFDGDDVIFGQVGALLSAFHGAHCSNWGQLQAEQFGGRDDESCSVQECARR